MKKQKVYNPCAQQVKFMTAAGFQRDTRLAMNQDLVYWKRGEIVMCLFCKDKVDPSKFTDRIIEQAVSKAKRAFSEKITWEVFYYKDDVNNLFKTKNE